MPWIGPMYDKNVALFLRLIFGKPGCLGTRKPERMSPHVYAENRRIHRGRTDLD